LSSDSKGFSSTNPTLNIKKAVLTDHFLCLLALVEYATNYFKEQIGNLSFPLQPAKPALALA
jgi:hypothetical protein